MFPRFHRRIEILDFRIKLDERPEAIRERNKIGGVLSLVTRRREELMTPVGSLRGERGYNWLWERRPL